MDTGSEERERGVTVDIAQFHFSTDHVDFTILDAPGHRDFIPNMIAGASMADLAVLVIDANHLESGIKGQTGEHIVLAKACGVSRIVVAVNKLDATNPPWSEAVLQDVVASITPLLTASGYKPENVRFVPCSGLNGQNVVKAMSKKGDASWVAEGYRTLLEELESCVAPHDTEEMVRAPLRMQIADVFRGSVTNPLSIAGRITSGHVQTGDTVLLQPSNERAMVRGIEVGGNGQEWAVAGQICTLHLTEVDQQHLRAGDCVCDAKNPTPAAKNFVVQLTALDSILPQAVDVHVGRLHAAGSITALISTIDDAGEVERKKPRVVKAGQKATARLVLDAGAALEAGTRLIIRANGSTIAVGEIIRAGG